MERFKGRIMDGPASRLRAFKRACKRESKRVCKRILLLLAVVSVTGCVVNPVTGRTELGWVTTADQIGIGQQQYQPAQQMQGGLYTVDPGVTAYVRQVGAKLAAVSDADLPYEFVVLNSGVPNAWALPGGKIAINRGLLMEMKNEAELAAVLGHELVHAAARHGAKQIERGTLLQVGLLGAALGTRNTAYSNVVVGSAQIGAQLLNQAYGRNAERESDYYGTRYLAKAGYDPYAAVTLQETFLRLSQGRGAEGLEVWFSSHPPSAERVSNNRSLVETLRGEGFENGEFGSDRYQSALRQLRQDAPAYAAYEDARKAYTNEEVELALGKINEAISLQPLEPAFHGFRGDIRLEQERYGDAITNYNRALERNDAFFAYHLGRGIAHNALDERAAAKRDLNASVELLPTSVAYLQLGDIAETEGEPERAVRYYEAAAQSEGNVGRQAIARLLRLDLPRQPDKYVSTRVARDDQGRLLLAVANSTPIPLADIRVRVSVQTADGQRLNFERRIGRLAGKEQQVLELPEKDVTVVDARAAVIAAVIADG